MVHEIRMFAFSGACMPRVGSVICLFILHKEMWQKFNVILLEFEL